MTAAEAETHPHADPRPWERSTKEGEYCTHGKGQDELTIINVVWAWCRGNVLLSPCDDNCTIAVPRLDSANSTFALRVFLIFRTKNTETCLNLMALD